MRIYVAASRGDIDLARTYMNRLRSAGNTITHDWIADIDRNGPNDTKVALDELFECACNDERGVRFADVFWLLAPAAGGSGCWVEFGMALALNKRIVVSGAIDRTLFTTLLESRNGMLFDDHVEALRAVLDLSAFLVRAE